MSDILSIYPNCSLGGMTTVYRNRALSNPGENHFLLFKNDFSGAKSYSGIDNLGFRIVRNDRFISFVKYTSSSVNYTEIRVTSMPELLSALPTSGTTRKVYEFHSSDEAILRSEISRLDTDLVDSIVVPSEYMRSLLAQLLPVDARSRLEVVPNLVDTHVFNPEVKPASLSTMQSVRPLIWIGRFDKGKNYLDFLRVLSLLPDIYTGMVIVSMEKTPERMAEFLAEVQHYGLSKRINILMNISPSAVAAIFIAAANRGGHFCSTSLGESFGYGVAEASASGLRTVAYEVGAMTERAADGNPVELVPVGNIRLFASTIIRMDGEESQAVPQASYLAG